MTNTPKALFFDLDGTLIDSDPIHAEVFFAYLQEFGLSVSQEVYDTNIHGRQNRQVFAEILPNEDAAALDYEKERRFRVELAKRGATPPKGITELLDRAAAAGIETALVTNACRENVEASLAAIGLSDRFAVRSLGDECTHAKPHPEPFLNAARQLGLAPEDCLTYEDSPTGIRASVAAGIPTIGMRSTLDDTRLRELGVFLSIDDFADPEMLKRVFG